MNDKTLEITQQKLTPDVYDMLEKIALASFESRRFGIAKQGEATIKLLFCLEAGLHLSTANTGLYIVNGKLAVQSNIISAKLRQHPNYDYEIKEHTDKVCTIEIWRLGRSGEWGVAGVSSFTIEDAKSAGLLSNDVWKKYPKNMLFGRAITNGYRFYAPDVFGMPLYIPEELGMKVDSEGSPIIEGSYSVNEPQEMTLKDLQEKFEIKDILAANNGSIPANSAEVKAVYEKLSGGESDD
jgi:hypothetical protein